MNTHSARYCTATTLAGPFLLALALTATSPNSVAASQTAPTMAASESLLFAEGGGWSLGKYLSGLNNRTRIVQFCVVIMCLALYILMRKFVSNSNCMNQSSGKRATREPKVSEPSATSFPRNE